jgi:hypothetical protein
MPETGWRRPDPAVHQAVVDIELMWLRHSEHQQSAHVVACSIPNVNQARTARALVLAGALIGVLLSTGSVAQARFGQVLVLISLMLSQCCAASVTGRLIVYSEVARQGTPV